jgi:hypothetical protein
MNVETLRAYQVLELEQTASPEDVKQAYRLLVKVWHPDRFPGDHRLQSAAEAKMKEINLAYERLSALASPGVSLPQNKWTQNSRPGDERADGSANQEDSMLAPSVGVPDRFMRGPTKEEMQRLFVEASKQGVVVGVFDEPLRTPHGRLAAGVELDPHLVGERLICYARGYSTTDTCYQMLVYSMLRDMDRSGMPDMKELANRFRAAFGTEGNLAETAGRYYFDSVEARAKASFTQRAAEALKDVKAGVCVRSGSKDSEVLLRNLVAILRIEGREQSLLVQAANCCPKGGPGGHRWQLARRAPAG